jgi:leucyl aminopeptidase (aminopeptidase T)
MAHVMDIMEVAYVCVDTCMGVQEGQKVLIIVDRACLDYGEALCAAANLKGARTAITIMPEPKPYDKEPNEIAIAGMKAADVVITAFSLPVMANQFIHTKALKDALDGGLRYGTFLPPAPGSRGVTAKDLLETRDRAYRLAERLTKAESARVTTALGTNVVMSLKGRKGTALSPICPKSKSEPGRWASMPNFSEAAVPPLEGSAEGLAVIDGMINWIGSVREPVRLSFKGGRVIEIAGGADAERLRTILGQADENATNVAELGIGTVADQLPIGGNIDKRLIGTAHFGLGDNYTLGGSVRSSIHLDALMYGVTVELDGEPVVKAGKVLV